METVPGKVDDILRERAAVDSFSEAICIRKAGLYLLICKRVFLIKDIRWILIAEVILCHHLQLMAVVLEDKIINTLFKFVSTESVCVSVIAVKTAKIINGESHPDIFLDFPRIQKGAFGKCTESGIGFLDSAFCIRLPCK